MAISGSSESLSYTFKQFKNDPGIISGLKF
jgi:hypothetical protein